MSLIDTAIKEKFSYLPEKLFHMQVTKQYKTHLIDSQMPSDMFNIICCTGDEDKESINESLQHFYKKCLPFAWWTGFDCDPEWLQEELISHGLNKSEEELAMQASFDQVHWQVIPKSLDITAVTDDQGVLDLMYVIENVVLEKEKTAVRDFFTASKDHLTSATGKLQFFIGYVEEMPVATSSIFFSEETAAIFDVVVLPSLRGRGIGKAMTLFAMKAIQNAGYTNCVLTATNNAKYLYEKLGFKAVKMMAVYSPMK